MKQTLYKKDTKSKIRQWTIETKEDKHRVTSGLKGGKLIVSEWTVCETKNEGRANATTGEAQAEKEALALIKKQKDKGYTEDVEDIDEAAVFKPMLAKDFNDYSEELVYPVYSQPKLDGIRCIINKDGMWSRNGKPITAAPHIFESVSYLFKDNPDLILDGELYNHELKENFNKICSLVKRLKSTPEELAESRRLVQYWCYDYVSDENFSDRSETLNKLLEGLEYVVKVETTVIFDRDDLDTAYHKYIEEGYEGQMVRINESYQHKRTQYLLKRKEWQDREWLIGEVFEGVGNRSRTAGYVTLLNLDGTPFLNEHGDPVKSNIKGSYEVVEQLWKDRKALRGKTVTVKYFNLTPAGVPRFPYVVAIRDYE